MLLGSGPAASATPVVEFYNAPLDHYFVTAYADEAAAIDGGASGPGWHRTGRVFGAWLDPIAAPANAQAVCRFYGNQAQGGPNSHFYTADPDECAQVKLDPGWSYEGIAFYVSGSVPECPAGTQPVRRNYNRRFAQHDSNHRYTTDGELYATMSAIGWATEGIVFCADASIATSARPPLLPASGLSPFGVGCDGLLASSTLYTNAEVEPMIAVNPRAPDNLIGVWQQDRWSTGGARGLVTGVSFDGGRSWERRVPAFSLCAGGNAANGGNYERASDPWVSFGPAGDPDQPFQ